jgi:hypothetical protein
VGGYAGRSARAAPTRALAPHRAPGDEASAHDAPSSIAAAAAVTVCWSFPFRLALLRARIARTVPCETSAAVAMSRCRESDPPGASDGLLVFAVGLAYAAVGLAYAAVGLAYAAVGLAYAAVGLALALRRAGDVPQHVRAQRPAGAQLAGALGIGDRTQCRACGDRGARGLGHTSLRGLFSG